MFLAIDTNGLPNTVQGFDPVVCALALASFDGVRVEAAGGLVRQPRYMIDHPYTYGALLANGLTADAISSAELTVDEAAARLRAHLGQRRPRGYHGLFVERVMAHAPWSFRSYEWGDPVMPEAAMAIHGGKVAVKLVEGRTVKAVKPKRALVSLDDACAWATERGFDVTGPNGETKPWTPSSGVLHCLDRVVRTAKLAGALTRSGAVETARKAAEESSWLMV